LWRHDPASHLVPSASVVFLDDQTDLSDATDQRITTMFTFSSGRTTSPVAKSPEGVDLPERGRRKHQGCLKQSAPEGSILSFNSIMSLPCSEMVSSAFRISTA
jgi:hypothetical protein